MKICQPKLILNPYDWLPGYGESKVSFHSMGMDVILEIEYERDEEYIGEIGYVQKLMRKIVFKFTRSFIRLPFPENMFFEFSGDSNEFHLGRLIEFRYSEWKNSMENNLNFNRRSGKNPLKHFSIQFLSENVAFHVLSESVCISDEQLVL